MLPFLNKINPTLNALSKNVIIIISVSYVFGFLIINTYLASYNIFMIELLKGRYVLTGFLFLLYFVSTIASGIISGNILSNAKIASSKKESAHYIFLFVLAGLSGCALSSILIPFFSLLGGNVRPHEIPVVSINFKDILLGLLNFELIVIVAFASVFFVFGLTIVAITYVLCSVIKDVVVNLIQTKGLKLNLRFLIKDFFKNINYKDGLTSITKYIFKVFLLMLLGILIISTINTLYPFTNNRDYIFHIIWQRLFAFSLLIILLMSTFMNLSKDTKITKPKEEIKKDSPKMLPDILSFVFIAQLFTPGIMLITLLFVWFYSFFVFPLLPVAIGGGRSAPIKVLTEDILLKEKLQKVDELILLDRTNDVYIILSIKGENSEVYQVPIDKIYLISE